jgi:hypothetical protein
MTSISPQLAQFVAIVSYAPIGAAELEVYVPLFDVPISQNAGQAPALAGIAMRASTRALDQLNFPWVVMRQERWYQLPPAMLVGLDA